MARSGDPKSFAAVYSCGTGQRHLQAARIRRKFIWRELPRSISERLRPSYD
jgi:hypothetical protein